MYVGLVCWSVDMSSCVRAGLLTDNNLPVNAVDQIVDYIRAGIATGGSAGGGGAMSAQSGSAPRSGRGGREFESPHSDQ
jgi:hypothetical protein